MFKYDDIGSSI